MLANVVLILLITANEPTIVMWFYKRTKIVTRTLIGREECLHESM